MAQKKEKIDNALFQTSLLVAIFKAQARIIAKLEGKDEKDILKELSDSQISHYQSLLKPSVSTRLSRR
jgi:hypothetical protein